MADDADTTIIYVTYVGSTVTRFDRDYYVQRHLSHVMQAWGQYGLEHLSAFFPEPTQAGTLCICECRFRDDAAVDAAFGSPETPAVMDDVKNFTDVEPVRYRAVPM